MNIIIKNNLIVSCLILFLFNYISIFSQSKEYETYGAIRCGRSLTPKQLKSLREKLLSDCQWDTNSDDRPILQCSSPSKSGRFLIHYDTIGCHAVSLIDKDKNGIPDYVDSTAYFMEYAYSMYVDSIGYLPPFIDSLRGGSNAFDVYLVDLGNGPDTETFYGLSQPDLQHPIKTAKGLIGYASFMMLDNNYSSNDSTRRQNGTKYRSYYDTSFLALKVTCCHEFHHCIQDSYCHISGGCLINELTSTFMEHRLVPEADDFMQYIRNLLRSPNTYIFGNHDYTNGYPYSSFGEYAYYYYGDKFLLRTWELIGCGLNPYTAMDSAFKELGNSSLPAEFCKFSEWLYFTGSRAVKGKYLWHSEDLPEIAIANDNFMTISEEMIKNIDSLLSMQGFLKPFEIRPIRYIFTYDNPNVRGDTLDAMLTNSDLNGAVFNSSQTKDFYFTVSNTQYNNYLSIDGTNYYYYLNTPNGFICDYLLINNGYESNLGSDVFPNPWKSSVNKSINFPAPNNAILDSKIHLSIYNLEMSEIYSNDFRVTADNDKRYRVVHLENVPNVLSSGVYIYKINYLGSDYLGKFTVIRK
jgi:hypothetical protein